MDSPLAIRLLDWYQDNRRELPWRHHSDPYAVWVSEVMLQQTRVETVQPYYRRWMETFPTVLALAAASSQEVLAVWEGLGYYRRARALHQAAQIVVDRFEGALPASPEDLQELPGIGRYTAGAIASMAFGWDTPAVDGNVRRVLARLFAVQEPVDTPAVERRIWQLAALHLPAGRAGDYNQAWMDLGALVCTPRAPRCPACPFLDCCQGYLLGWQERLPVRSPRASRPHHTVAAAVIQEGHRILIARRPADGLLGGLWEFPGGKLEPGEDLEQALKREICEELQIDIHVGEPLGVYEHGYSHFRVTLHAFHCSVSAGEPRALHGGSIEWVMVGELDNFPMGKIDRQIARRLQAGSGT